MSVAKGPDALAALLDDGLEHYRKGRLAEAVRTWEAALRIDPGSVRVRELLRAARERVRADGPSGEVLPTAADLGAPAGGGATWKPPVRPQAPQRAPRRPSPWDEGPSVAVPHESDSVAGGLGWGIHADAGHDEKAEDASQTAIWLRGARELQALADFSGALELTAKILQHEPGHAEAERIRVHCEDNLTQMFESKLGALSRRPRIAIKPDEVIWLNLDPHAGFVLSQIDGEVSLEDLYAICSLPRLDTARILAQLLEEGVVRLDDSAPPPAAAGGRRRP